MLILFATDEVQSMNTPEIALEAPPSSRTSPEAMPRFVVLEDEVFDKGSRLTLPPPDGDAIYGRLIESTRPMRQSEISLKAAPSVEVETVDVAVDAA